MRALLLGFIVLLTVGTCTAESPACPKPSWAVDLSSLLGFLSFSTAPTKQLPPVGTYERGILFFSSHKLLVYQIVGVDRQRLIPREHAWNEGPFILKLAVLNVEERKIEVAQTVYVEADHLRVYPLSNTRILLRTANHLVVLSEGLQVLASTVLPPVGSDFEKWDIRVSNTGKTIVRSHFVREHGSIRTTGNFLNTENLLSGPDLDISHTGIVAIGDQFLLGVRTLAGQIERIDARGMWSEVPIAIPEERKYRCRGTENLVSEQFLFVQASCETIEFRSLDGRKVAEDTLDRNTFVGSFVSRGSIVAAQILKGRWAPFDSGSNRRPVAINIYDMNEKDKMCSIPTTKVVSVLSQRDLYTVSEVGYVAYIQDSVLNVVRAYL